MPATYRVFTLTHVAILQVAVLRIERRSSGGLFARPVSQLCLTDDMDGVGRARLEAWQYRSADTELLAHGRQTESMQPLRRPISKRATHCVYGKIIFISTLV